MSESLKQKIQNVSKPLHEISERLPTLAVGDKAHEYWETRYVSVDVVSGLLDNATEQINQIITEQINQIMCEDYWTCYAHLNKVREKILSVLDEGVLSFGE